MAFIGIYLDKPSENPEAVKRLNKIPEVIESMGSYAGIKVDTGAKSLAGSPNEKITEGLDGLRDRLKEYYKLGAKFTKWRGVYSISENYPSKLSIQSKKGSPIIRCCVVPFYKTTGML